MPDIVEISVRPLVEYVFRGGSIESGFRTGSPLTEGTKAHRSIQQTYKETDRKEAYVEADVEYGDIVYRLEGRCDGLLFNGDEVTVEEIKSTAGQLELITEETYPVHWAQAQCYAYMYAKADGKDHMTIRLTYVHRKSEEQKRFERTLTYAELEAFVLMLLQAYDPYARLQLRHAEERGRSIKELPFPFEAYRQGQRKFAGAVYKSIAEQKRLFARAPTGTGKTISTLFPAVKAIGEGVLRRLFYLTAKTTTRTLAEEAFALMRSKGLRLRCVTLTAKEKICFKEETRCQKEFCEFADGYYDRINGALSDLWSGETAINREVIEAYARKHRVCPFEFSLDAAYAADAVICDYNYVYDPRISLKRLLDEQKRQTAVLIDEAHNLVDRGRDMYSAELIKSPFLELKRQTKARSRALYDTVKAVNDAFITLRKKNMEQSGVLLPEEEPQTFIPLLEAFSAEAEAELLGAPEGEYRQLLTDTYYAAQHFIRTAGYYDEKYISFAEFERSEVRMKLLCVDPSGMLRLMGKGYRSQVYFSATLSPISYYRDMLGGEADDYTIAIPSPFRKEQLDVLLLPVSTRYRDRERSKEPIAAMLHQAARERPGNYLVFFPSYEYMNEVYSRFAETEFPGDVLVQQGGMSEEERESFLASFRSGAERTLLGFAVMGGVFSEGVDLTGDRLTGVVVVGVGLPQFGRERDWIRQYFDGTGRNGFDYAYKYPGMNKVLQAGGRLIRTEQDRGTLVLVDDRFLQPDYNALLPEEWKPATILR
ncbi:ATP-dependent DNA helicase [Paenibacillus mesophilus]|uniref:helicase C-terminal domain-containing protein n=1 Tax=Paenibacillus mesophilus TaxID=2582849 RepID=UPI00110D27AB|nr:helicase C-terminal domain-containing protein [Paenibacillus mesophilus]TMV48072.1 ATP-dependent DNA helicase [Paenibacillus mesophilus]